MLSPNKIIFFDFDGVFVNSLSTAFDIIQTNQSNLTLENYRTRFEGNINETVDLNKPLQVAHQKATTFFDAYAPRLLQLPLIPAMTNVATQLAAQYPLYIVSSTISSAIAAFLVQHKLAACFTKILGNDVAKSKVKKFKMVLADTGLTPADSIFITDTLGDIREADEVGIATIAVTWGYHDQATLERGTPYALVTQADEIIPHIEAFFTKTS